MIIRSHPAFVKETLNAEIPLKSKFKKVIYRVRRKALLGLKKEAAA
jgi:hypothetical protein